MQTARHTKSEAGDSHPQNKCSLPHIEETAARVKIMIVCLRHHDIALKQHETVTDNEYVSKY